MHRVTVHRVLRPTTLVRGRVGINSRSLLAAAAESITGCAHRVLSNYASVASCGNFAQPARTRGNIFLLAVVEFFRSYYFAITRDTPQVFVVFKLRASTEAFSCDHPRPKPVASRVSQSMIVSRVFASAALIASVVAHATWQELWINGVDYGGSCVRLPSSNNPVYDNSSVRWGFFCFCSERFDDSPTHSQ